MLVVYHSQSGTVESLVKSIAIALADDNEIDVIIKRAVDCVADDVSNANLLLLAASENCGLMSGGIKEFLDRVYYPLMGKVEGMSYGMSKSVPPLILKGEFSLDTAKRADEYGLTLAAGLSVGMF